MSPIIQEYIGDGVYADFYIDGGFRLWTERNCGTHEIYFEPGMLESLTRLRDAAMRKPEQKSIDT